MVLHELQSLGYSLYYFEYMHMSGLEAFVYTPISFRFLSYYFQPQRSTYAGVYIPIVALVFFPPFFRPPRLGEGLQMCRSEKMS